MGGDHHGPEDHYTIDPKWFDGLEAGVPIENPIKVRREGGLGVTGCREGRAEVGGVAERTEMG